ncbi:Na+/H+ antiporter [Rhizosphaericola mali]|uniref:Na+/H+ antiporter n=1 Tax=Rhizosphaericola mali TaxID=2545455 RepID=A0A5P2GE51_9BACT|nr:Na+/H+ antiporter [Rhizosphaericola mali]QES89881.1 Na+/H+ antiporter [Rhizosphaericola mali]
MHHHLLLILGLLFAVMLLVMLAKKLKIAYPIFLVIAGILTSLIPGVPDVHIEPDVIFLIFLPPLLYEAAWYTAWNDFWKLKRPIILLAFGLVFFTSSIIAYSSTWLIPGFTLAMGFLLGGIVSPPDAVAAGTVMKGLGVPKKIMTILEGESLVNDASSLIVVSFALTAVKTGTFSLGTAVGSFFWVAIMGVLVGLVIGFIMKYIHKYLPTTPAIDAALTWMTPYIMYLVAESFGFSGVMATVTGGLFISYHANTIFQSGETRVNMLGVWTTVIFVLNALVFVLIGLELPEILKGLGSVNIGTGIKYGLIISLLVIVIRFVWVYATSFIQFGKKRSPNRIAGWKESLIISFSGMRGVVSLATALSIPFYISETNNIYFPQRNLTIFVTFIVIVVTLVGQGLILPFIIKMVKLPLDNEANEDEQITNIQLKLNTKAMWFLNKKFQKEITDNELIGFYFEDLQHNVNISQQRLDSLECDETTLEEIDQYHQMLLEVYSMQRMQLFEMRRSNAFSDEALRKVENQLDLDSSKING